MGLIDGKYKIMNQRCFFVCLSINWSKSDNFFELVVGKKGMNVLKVVMEVKNVSLRVKI